MYTYGDIRRVHLEMTTRCNALCPMCSRNRRGGGRVESLPDAELSAADIRRLLLPAFVRQLEQVLLCGNYGDPIVAADTLSVARYLKECSADVSIALNTNGSARDARWWADLAGVTDVCHFGIDGLEDTNHLYRRNTTWSIIMQSATAYIGAGGTATWEFIAFAHNEHQIDEARRLAGEMGFRRFHVRKTGRFFFQGQRRSFVSVVDSTGNEQYRIEPPRSDFLANTETQRFTSLAGSDGGYGEYLDTTPIHCKAQRGGEIYISAEGLVFPCCYLANIYRERVSTDPTQFERLLERHGGRATIDGRQWSVEAVVGSGLFQHAVPETWTLKSVSAGRLAVCAATCGDASPTKGEYTPSLI